MTTKRVAIIGGRDTLKKKLHLGVLALLLQAAAKQLVASRETSVIAI